MRCSNIVIELNNQFIQVEKFDFYGQKLLRYFSKIALNEWIVQMSCARNYQRSGFYYI